MLFPKPTGEKTLNGQQKLEFSFEVIKTWSKENSGNIGKL